MTYRLAWALGFLISSLPMMGNAANGDGLGNTASSGRLLVADKGDDLPLSRDALFAVPPEPAKEREQAPLPASKDDLFALEPAAEKQQKAQPDAALPASRDALFGAETPAKEAKKVVADAQGADPISGFFQTEIARTYAGAEHWSKVLGRLELGTQGRFGQDGQWKLSGRVDYNAVYDLTDFYQSQVRDDQRAEFQLRETYLDFPAGGWDWRIGRQQIVWGEMVGLFFADVVSAKDLREYVLPDFQVLRIPQWAARTEYFNDDFHAEVVWIPFPSYDEVGKPFELGKSGSGSDFYPYPLSPAGIPIIGHEEKPGYGFDHSNFGIRFSQLTHGWDLSGFYYTSMDSSPTFLRDPVVQNRFTPVHKRIWQAGGTLAKDLGSFVLKAEAIYTDGRQYNVVNLTDSDGLVQQNTLDWAVGLDFNPSNETRLNTQLFQRIYFDHEPDINFDKVENGFSLLVHYKFPHKWEADVLLISSLNRGDWLLRPKLACQLERDWRLTFGLDIFKGPPTGIFGQYDDRDRIYTEVRYDF